MRGDRRQFRHLRVVPRHHHRAGALEGQVQALMHAPVERIARLDQLQLEAACRLVEAGMQQRAVAFARAFEDVRGLFHKHRAPAANGEGARYCAPDDAGSNDGDIVEAVRICGAEGHFRMRNNHQCLTE